MRIFWPVCMVFLASEVHASQTTPTQPIQNMNVLRKEDVAGLKQDMLGLDEDDQKAYHQTVLDRSVDLVAVGAIFSDPDLAHPPASSFIPQFYLDMGVQAENYGYFYMSTEKHKTEFHADTHPSRYFVATLLSGHVKTDFYSRFFYLSSLPNI